MQENLPKPKRRWGVLLLTFVAGMIAMAGVGLAMRSTDQAAFCAGCHVMSEAAWTHKASIHAELACNECHTPYDIAPKLPYKTASGLRDITTNTFGSVADVIHATKDTKNVIQANCRRCHTATVQTVAMDVKPYCTDCHRAVPHNKKLPIDRRKAADV